MPPPIEAHGETVPDDDPQRSAPTTIGEMLAGFPVALKRTVYIIAPPSTRPPALPAVPASPTLARNAKVRSPSGGPGPIRTGTLSENGVSAEITGTPLVSTPPGTSTLTPPLSGSGAIRLKSCTTPWPATIETSALPGLRSPTFVTGCTLTFHTPGVSRVSSYDPSAAVLVVT